MVGRSFSPSSFGPVANTGGLPGAGPQASLNLLGGGEERRPRRRLQGSRAEGHLSLGGLTLERVLIYVAVFFSPFLDLSTDLVFFTLSDAIYCAAFATLLLRRKLPSAPLGLLTWPWMTSFLLIAGGLHLSSMLAGDALRGLVLLAQYAFCFLVLPHVLLGWGEREAYRLLGVFLAGVAALDAHGIAVFYLVGYTPDSAVVSGNGRLETLIGGANAAAYLNAVMIVIVLWLRMSGKISWALATCLFAVMLTTIVLTSSNGGLIGTAVGLLTFMAWSFRLVHILKIVPVLAIPAIFLLAGGATYLPATFQKRVLPALTSGDVSEAGTFNARSELMREAVEMIDAGRISLVGVGADQFRTKSEHEAPVHNGFLLLWAEGGVLSLLGWVLFCCLGGILWYAAVVRGVMPYGRAAVFASFVVFIFMTNVSAHIYARYWYTALLLIMQPTIIALVRPSGRDLRG